MRRCQFSLRTLFVVMTLTALLSAIGAFFALPPWHNKASFYVHRWLANATGWELHYLTDYTGTARFWDSKGRLREEYEFVGGQRHGRWVTYDETGAIQSECEYRNGDSWDGVCQIFARKGWVGEYEDGKPWNGYLPAPDSGEWACYLNGQLMSKEEYKRQRGLGPGVRLTIGHHLPEAESERRGVKSTSRLRQASRLYRTTALVRRDPASMSDTPSRFVSAAGS